MNPISPLRYPGGKTRAVEKLKRFVPKDVKLMCSPFFGGGSFEIFCALSLGIKVVGYDLFEPLVIFWKCLFEDPERLAEMAASYLPVVSREQFNTLECSLSQTEDRWELATAFYVLNRTSFSGLTISGGFAPLTKEGTNSRFNSRNVEFLKGFTVPDGMMSVEHSSFEQSLQRHPHDFTYLDPPYLVKSKLYGNKGDLHNVDHDLLASILHTRSNWILSYNDCPEVRQLYKEFSIVGAQDGLAWGYGMTASRKSREILILSDDVAERVGFTKKSTLPRFVVIVRRVSPMRRIII